MQPTFVLIGAGGIGAPAAWALCESGARDLVVVDEDAVELGNLHRQILFEDADVGRPKIEALAAAIGARFSQVSLRTIEGRALPDTVMAIAARAAVLLDATDNFASRFLLADAAHLAQVPVVHAAAVRWQATVIASLPVGRPCYRCLFEDIPTGVAVDCATAGVAGPVCGVAGAIAADRALRLAGGDRSATGHIVTYDGLTDRLREVAVARRADCPLCGDRPTIGAIDVSRYMSEVCYQ
jgi:adenylyltransferase/sulfurtransferase